MDLTDIKIFRELFTRRNITEISRGLNLSQPTVSYRLSKMQQELGVTLYEYDGKYRFTQNGTLFYRYCERTLADFDSVVDRFIQKNRIRITLSAVANYLYLDTIFSHLLESGVYPVIISASSQTAITDLFEGHIDAAIVGGIQVDLPQEIEKSELREEKIILIFHKTLSDDIEKIPLIIDEPLSGLHSIVMDYIDQFEDKTIIAEIGTYADKVALTANQHVGCFVPESYLTFASPDNIRISEKYFFTRKIYFLLRKPVKEGRVMYGLIEKLNSIGGVI
jgi:DNA-binding transcriptional LysR family regulator